jgi:N-acetylated-alpha-linked acidic dipeptidase
VKIHRYDVLSSNPREARRDGGAAALRADHARGRLSGGSDTARKDIRSAWLSFSASGDVTAPVVYANSGNPEDYDRLRAAGIDPKGKIVIVRYSVPYSYRGFKALTAQREGAAGLIVYSDPAEDGFTKGEVFPKGPYGPDSHFQRGGIAYDYIVPGDPLTPGWASTPGAHRITKEEAVSVPTIMGVPLSWRDAKPIMESLGGPPAPKEWQGAMGFEYRLGGEARVRMKVDMRTDVQPNWVVEARIKGSERPDEWVTLGNHHDAWVFGGVDPSSGTSSLMETTRALGEMLKRGQRPRRTLIFCAWDGEEVTLTGSTEWGEHFAADLRKKLVAYLNVDSSASGPNFEANAVGSLAPVLVDVARELKDPSGVSLYDAWKKTEPPAQSLAEGSLLDQKLVTTRIGSGSDHTVFLNYLARPVVDMTFNGPYGVYHSAYDNHYWISKIGDPGFRYHTLMSQYWGTLALRLANADVLPYQMDEYAASLREFIRALDQIPGLPNNLDTSALVERTRALRTTARQLHLRVETALAKGQLGAEAGDLLNRDLLDFEANWAHPAGIPGRPWFKHLLYAPRYTYAAMTLPGITEAAETGNWPLAREQAALVEAAIAKNEALLSAAADRLAASAPAADTLESRLRAIRDRVDGRMAVYVENVHSGERVIIDGDSEYETFSVIKVPIMATVLDQVRTGKLTLDQRVPMKLDQRRIPSGVLYALDAGSSRRAGSPDADDHHQRQPGHRRAGRSRGPRQRHRTHGQPWSLQHAHPLLGSRLGSPVALRARSHVGRRVGRQDHRLSVRQAPGREGERGVPARHRGYGPLLRPQHRPRHGAPLLDDGARRAGVEGRQRADDRHPEEAAGERPAAALPGRRRHHRPQDRRRPALGGQRCGHRLGERPADCHRRVDGPPPRHERRSARGRGKDRRRGGEALRG